MLRSCAASLLLVIGLATSLYAVEIKSVATIHQDSGGPPSDGEKVLTVHFIDVGGGDAILIDTPGNKKILIDGGYTYGERAKAKKEYDAYLDRFLEDDVIDLVVITHPDFDHFAALEDVLDERVVRQVWFSGYDSDELSGTWSRVKRKLEEDRDTLFVSPLHRFFGLGSVIRFDHAYTYGKDDDTTLTLINTKQWLSDTAYRSNPARTLDEGQRRNSTSIVLRMDFGETSFLFTGDTNGREKGAAPDACDDQEKYMLDNHLNRDNILFGSLDCDVLKVAHHGSDGSSSLPFLKAVKPSWAVIPAGVPYGHPHAPTLQRLKNTAVGLDDAHILRTDHEDTGNASERTLGDDCYIFTVTPTRIASIERWSVNLD